MIPQELIESIKRISIVNYLLSVNIEPVKYSGIQLVYFSPKHTEHTPSFFVNPVKNVFHDYTNDERGDIIRLVQYLTGCNFIQAVQTLQKFEPVPQPQTFLFSGRNIQSDERASKMEITNTCPIRHGALFKYVKDRGISQKIASKYLKEIHFKRGNQRGFAVAFENDKGGYEFRNPFFKGSTAPKWITTFPVVNSTTVDVFEGFFDFLSSLEFFGLLTPRNTTIVLNSVSHTKSVLDSLKTYKMANLYFDNDSAGERAKELIKSTGIKVIDGSKYYQGYKDFNEYITIKTA